MVSLLTENIGDDVFEAFSSAEREINIISPFIGDETAKKLVEVKQQNNISISLITKFSRADFFTKASSLEAIDLLEKNGVGIFAVKHLSTKIYLIDNDAMIFGASNFARGGFVSNNELNILVEKTEDTEDNDSEIIGKGNAYFDELKIRIRNEFKITSSKIQDEIKELEKIRAMSQTPTSIDAKFDFGYEDTTPLSQIKVTDVLENCFSGQSTSTAWIKFEADSKNRTPPDKLVAPHQQLHFPKKPSIATGDLVFLAALSYDAQGTPAPMIYGYCSAEKWQPGQEENDPNARWPYYININDIKYVHGKFCDCVPFYDLTTNVGADAFPSTVGTNKDVSNIHSQKTKLRITDKAKDYLLKELVKRNCH